jgi:hypothetical protein
MIAVPDNVEFAYHGFFFNSSVRTKVTETPVWSGDGRVVKNSNITIHAAGYLTQDDVNDYAAIGIGEAGGTLDAFMERLRRTLQVPGKQLLYKGKGYGLNLNVNANPQVEGSVTDVAFGPKPIRFTWWPMGGAPDGCHAAGFEFEISTSIAECENWPQNPGASHFLEISYTVTYDVGEDGLVTITTAGTAQIPLSMRADGTLPRTIDDVNVIDSIVRPVPIGFMRRHTRQISADRASIHFTFIDRQVEIPYPDDVIEIEMDQTIRQEKNSFSRFWACSISGMVRLSPTADKFLAARRFFNIAVQRMAFARRSATVGTDGMPGILVLTSEMRESYFKNQSRFTINYRMLGAPLNQVIKRSGLWRTILSPQNPAQSAEWNATTANLSLQGNAQRFKGLIGASFGQNTDLILDVCAGPVSSLAIPPEPGRNHSDAFNAAPPGVASMTDAEADATQLTDTGEIAASPDGSWINWECSVEHHVNHNIVRHTALTGEVTYNSAAFDSFGLAGDVANNAAKPESSWRTPVDDVLQQVARPALSIRLVGFGVRMNYRVSPPKVVTYGGRTAVLSKEWFRESTFGGTVYRTDWDLTYELAGPIDAGALPADPFLAVDGDRLSNPVPGS